MALRLLRAMLVLLGVSGAAGVAAPALAQRQALSIEQTVPALRPGEFRWFDTARATPASFDPAVGDSSVSIVISIPSQRAYVYRGGVLIGVSTVSTGKPGKETPIGEFTILQKQVFHRSNKYSGAPMPWMQRLTWDGVALHAGHLPGYPASHGCIRLPAAFARQLYDMTAVGGTVEVTDMPVDAVPPPRAVPPLMADSSGLGGESFNVVTVSGDAREAPQAQPASWVTGPRQEIVQPIPGSTKQN